MSTLNKITGRLETLSELLRKPGHLVIFVSPHSENLACNIVVGDVLMHAGTRGTALAFLESHIKGIHDKERRADLREEFLRRSTALKLAGVLYGEAIDILQEVYEK